ncbi:MAG: discoidin domain-containing protein [Anaerolineae bacterium]
MPWEATPTTTVEKGPDSEQRSLENELKAALETVDSLQKTATAIAEASAAVPSATDTAPVSSTSAPPVIPTPTQALAPAVVPPATATSITAGGTVAPTPAVVTMVPASATASSEPACSQDSQGNPVCYPASNVIDGETATAWRESLLKNPWIEVELDQAMLVTQIAIVGGYAKIDPFDGSDRWRQNYRPRRVRVYLDDMEEGVHELSDVREWQEIEVQALPARRVRLVIIDSYPPLEGARPYVAISEINVIGYQP